MVDENTAKPEGQAADKPTSDGGAEQKSVEYFQGQTDKIQAEFDKYKQDSAPAVKGYEQLQGLYTKYDGSDGKTPFSDYMKNYFEEPKKDAKPSSGFDPTVDYDPTEAATNPDSQSAKYQKQLIANSIKEMGFTSELLEEIKASKQERVEDEQHTQYIGKLMDKGLSATEAIDFIEQVKTGGDDFLLNELAPKYFAKADNLQHVRETQEQPPSVAGIQGAGQDTTTPDDDAWTSIVKQTGSYKETFAP